MVTDALRKLEPRSYRVTTQRDGLVTIVTDPSTESTLNLQDLGPFPGGCKTLKDLSSGLSYRAKFKLHNQNGQGWRVEIGAVI